MTFEEAQKELERIVQQLESGQADLDEAITLWERGEELYRLCSDKLDSAQGKIEELARRVGDAGALTFRQDAERIGSAPHFAEAHVLESGRWPTRTPPSSSRTSRSSPI